jgi:hypothetical protein
MDNYTPFLKLKVNEIGALKALDNSIKNRVSPFFDLPRKDVMTEESLLELINRSAASVSRNLNGYETFYVDNFDIDDSLRINGEDSYRAVIDAFGMSGFIPVTGIDRAPGRHQLIVDRKEAGEIKSDSIALRILPEDFEDFELVRDELVELVASVDGVFERWILVFDNRVCNGIDIAERAASIAQFLIEAIPLIEPEEIVITGSSIPSSIREVAAVQSETNLVRTELLLFRAIQVEVPDVALQLGDYTIVSPLYSDLDIPPEAMLNVMAPKITYSHGDEHFIIRGGALKTHPRGNLQYNDLAAVLVRKAFFRRRTYSEGDAFLDDKANCRGSNVTPSSILKPTINAHLTYMLKEPVL